MELFIVSISTVDKNGNFYSTILKSRHEKQIVGMVNSFFAQQEQDGHKVAAFPVNSFDEINREYHDERKMRIHLVVTEQMNIENSYEAYTLSRLEDYKEGGREEAFANVLLSEINHGSFNEKKFAEALCREHPTIQQMFFRIVKQSIITRAETTSCEDERNQASVKMCRELAELIKRYGLPLR